MRLIDADEYIEKLRDRIRTEPTWNLGGLRIAIFELHNMPTIDPVKHGRWIKLYHGNYKCSECGDWWGNDDNEMVEDFNYCPNCGARMAEGEEG